MFSHFFSLSHCCRRAVVTNCLLFWMFPANKVVTTVTLRTAFTVLTTSTDSTSSNSFVFLRFYMSCNAMLNRNKHVYGCKNRFLNSDWVSCPSIYQQLHHIFIWLHEKASASMRFSGLKSCSSPSIADRRITFLFFFGIYETIVSPSCCRNFEECTERPLISRKADGTSFFVCLIVPRSVQLFFSYRYSSEKIISGNATFTLEHTNKISQNSSTLMLFSPAIGA